MTKAINSQEIVSFKLGLAASYAVMIIATCFSSFTAPAVTSHVKLSGSLSARSLVAISPLILSPQMALLYHPYDIRV
jgi:hypothetical protein